MRILFSVSILSVVTVCAATIACSGADDAPKPAGDTTPSFSSTNEDSGPPPSSSTEIPNKPTDSGTGNGNGNGNGNGTGGGALCEATSIRETEPNNDLAAANKIEAKTSTYCGKVAAGNPDFVKFTMPAKRWEVEDPVATGGSVSIAVFVDGEEQDLFNLPLKVGSEYVVQISTDDADVSYRMPMRFN